MPSYPPVQSVMRALSLLAELNTTRVGTVGRLHQATGLPKPTVVRLLETLVAAGYVSGDARLGGYQVTSLVGSLSCGFHGAPLVIEAARPWAIDLTRKLKWPVAIAMLDADAVAVRFSTIGDSPVSPFHATLNMRLSLVSRALGRAYIANCPGSERRLLVERLRESRNPEDGPPDLVASIRRLVSSVKARGFAERDPKVEPRSSQTVAVPIMAEGRVLATIGLTYFRAAVPQTAVPGLLAAPLIEAARQIERSLSQMKTSG